MTRDDATANGQAPGDGRPGQLKTELVDLDTRVVNGRIVAPQADPCETLAILDGRFVDDDGPDRGVWRTVDASGFIVSPGLVQPGSPVGEPALAAARQGVTTVLPLLRATTVASLERELEELVRSARLDFIPRWSLDASVEGVTITQARAIGIDVFDAGRSPGPGVAKSLEGAVVRVPASHPALPEWLALSGLRRLVVTAATPAAVADVAGRHAAGPVGFEIDPSTLAAEPGWDLPSDPSAAIVVAEHGDGFPLMPFLYDSCVTSGHLTVDDIVRLAAQRPSELYDCAPRKGVLSSGSDADLFVFDPDTRTGEQARWPGRIIFSLQRGNILLYNDELHALDGDGLHLRR